MKNLKWLIGFTVLTTVGMVTGLALPLGPSQEQKEYFIIETVSPVFAPATSAAAE